MYTLLFEPFIDYSFMRRALVACFALSIGAAPIGVILTHRRLSLVGDTMSHAVLPGAAIGYMIAGFSVIAMSIGGLIAGLVVAFLSGITSRRTQMSEDTSLAAFYLISLALGVLLISQHGNNLDLMHILFGSILAVDNAALILIASITTVTLLTLSLIYRGLFAECLDPLFLQSVEGRGSLHHMIFLLLMVLNLIGGFIALGTLMAVGMLILPAAAARFWANRLPHLMAIAALITICSGYIGLLISYHYGAPSGPAIILAAGGFYIFSILCGRSGGVILQFFKPKHFVR